MAIRSNILTNLETRIKTEIPSFPLVTRILRPPFLPFTPSTSLPAVFIIDPEEEVYDYQASRHALTSLSTQVHLYRFQWNEDKDGAVDSNSSIDKLKDAIHKDITNGSLSVNTSITSIKPILRDYPLFGWSFDLVISYYADYTTS